MNNFHRVRLEGSHNSLLGESLRNLSPAEQRDYVKQVVLNVAKGVLQQDTFAADAPLLEAGMDSLLAVEFRNRLKKELPGVKLSYTVTFDYPTVDAIAGFALSQVAPAASYDPLGLIEPRDMRRCEVMESNEFVMNQRFTSQNDDLLTNVLMAFETGLIRSKNTWRHVER